MEPEGRIALVTGAARRLGRHLAVSIAEAGAASVVIHHHASPDHAEAVREEIQALGVRAIVVQADLTRTDEIPALFERVGEALGRLDLLVNSAALFQHRAVMEITPEEWNRVLGLNLTAPFFCSQHAARLMGQEGGQIINIADVAAFQPWSGYAHHSVSKAGIVMLTRVLAKALAPRIRVNAVAPGTVLPPADLDASQRQDLADATALKRLGSPQDVAEAVLFLARSRYITGETIVVDGGKILMT